MQIHMDAFTTFTADYNTDPSFYCREPAMLFRRKFSYWLHHDDYELDKLPDPGRVHFWYAKDKESMPRKKRSQPARRSSKFDGRLITSVHKQHSAREEEPCPCGELGLKNRVIAPCCRSDDILFAALMTESPTHGQYIRARTPTLS